MSKLIQVLIMIIENDEENLPYKQIVNKKTLIQ